MGQTILCEVIAEWEETGEQPDFTQYGFASVLSALKGAQDIMFELGTSCNRLREKLDSQQSAQHERNNMADFILLVKGKFDWRVVSNPRFDLPTQEGLAAKLLENPANRYVEYENCGITYRVVRAKEAAEPSVHPTGSTRVHYVQTCDCDTCKAARSQSTASG